jgi:hypothetical protein
MNFPGQLPERRKFYFLFRKHIVYALNSNGNFRTFCNIAWFFRYKCMDYTGCFIALSIVNCFTPLIRLAEEKLFLNRENKKANAL